VYERVASNIRKTWMLIAAFVVLTLAIGFFFGTFTNSGFWGIGIAAVVAIAMTWGSYFSSDKIALAMSRAKPAEGTRYRQVHNIVEGLSIAAGIPKPRVYIVEDTAPNAFATGRNPEHGAIAVTTGLLAKLDRDELEGVIAHELSHIQNRDTLVMTIAVTLVGVIVLLADMVLRFMWFGGRDENSKGLAAPLAIFGFVLLLISPLVAQLMQLAVSRQREFLADADAVMLTRYPPGLIGALRKLQGDQTVVRTASRATAHLWIESPIALQKAQGQRGATRQGAWLNRLFETHPPLEKRIEALESTALSGSYQTAPPPPAAGPA
jgi:heat shock protein HtpX